MTKRILIVGGDTAGWITACYLARMLSADLPGGAAITLVESDEIPTVGVGEGTFPSIRKTLARIGMDEASLVREANATFKQGIRFDGWRRGPAGGKGDSYLHPFQVAQQHSDMDLLPYWLLGAAGQAGWDEVSSVQKHVIEARRAPKLLEHENYSAPLNYAYHFDATRFAALLRTHALSLGVRRVADTVDEVRLGEDGTIAEVVGRAAGPMRADLYIDCSGFRATLIGGALGSPFTSCRDQLFCNRAVTLQLPDERADAPIASCTISTAQEAGWTWDIGLTERRGIGYVYSTDHSSDARAEAVLRAYAGPRAADAAVRTLSFEAGFRRAQWMKNCVAIGLSAGFIEPLEATGIGFAEIAALILANLFPWNGGQEVAARHFNRQMARRYEHVIDFIKLHYFLSKRSDHPFWTDNREPASLSPALTEKLAEWRTRPPSFLDVDTSHDIFTEHNWQYVLYGMGFRTDISGRAGALRFGAEARAEFAEIRRQRDYALQVMPDHRQLVEAARRRGFGARGGAARMPAAAAGR